MCLIIVEIYSSCVESVADTVARSVESSQQSEQAIVSFNLAGLSVNISFLLFRG